MEVSDWIALGALVVAVVALVVGAVQNRRTRKQAEAGAASAEAIARESREIAERQAAAAERSAKAAELTAEAMGAVVDETKRVTATRQTSWRVEAPERAGDLPLSLEKGRGQTYVLRNVSAQTLEGVTVLTDHPEALTRNVPNGETLRPGQGIAFLMAGSMQARLPSDVRVTWQGATEPVDLALPPK